MNNLLIRCEAYGGADTRSCVIDACAAANRLDIDIHVKINGVNVIATPRADPDGLFDLYDAELKSDRRHKVVCWHPKRDKSVAEKF